MVTAWLPWRIVRTRSGAGPSVRVPALAVLLFAFLMTRGIHVESAPGHFSTSVTTPAALNTEDVHRAVGEPERLSAGADERHGSHDASHPGEHCASGQPQQGSPLMGPCFAAKVRESTDSNEAAHVRGSAVGRSADGASAAALRAASVVRQV
ncbi:hypothetical protein [Streptomyces sp. NPDC057253]|uniref:hypothetical protein n=1 Tax=Streptomyces sp. NPDC057253 TaxID=3346069 RepID=UPI0036374F13